MRWEAFDKSVSLAITPIFEKDSVQVSPTTIALRTELMMVLYQSGSLYEQYLLSGLGAGHYDAAKDLGRGMYLPMWLDSRTDVSLLNSTSHLSLPTPANHLDAVSGPPSGALTTSRVWRSGHKNKK